jgi:hypothetical protein
MLTLAENRSKRDSTRPTSTRSSIGCLQYYFQAYGMFDANLHQSCVKSSTISKWTEPSFHLSHVTTESHRVRPKRFLCLWYVRCEPCTCLALTLTPSPNGLKRDSTRPMSLTSPSGASQTICEPMLRSVQTVHLSCVKISTISKRTEQSSTRPTSLSSTIGCV